MLNKNKNFYCITEYSLSLQPCVPECDDMKLLDGLEKTTTDYTSLTGFVSHFYCLLSKMFVVHSSIEIVLYTIIKYWSIFPSITEKFLLLILPLFPVNNLNLLNSDVVLQFNFSSKCHSLTCSIQHFNSLKLLNGDCCPTIDPSS